MKKRRVLPGRGRPGGSALIMGLVFAMIAMSLMLAGLVAMKSNRLTGETWFRMRGQASAFAKAGLVEALSWFRKQSTQPVTTFAPKKDTTAVPPILDTDDPSIGLVREFEISGALWGRYEVPLTEVEDISASRGVTAGSGTVWKLVSRGIVFKRVSPSAPYNQAPNQVLARGKLVTEIRRFALTPPAKAAICSPQGSSITVSGTNAQIMGGSMPALAYLRNTGSPSISGSTIQGGTYVIPPDPSDPVPSVEEAFGAEAVFGGVSEEDIRSMADLVVTSNSQFPSPVPPNSVVFADCDLTFSTAHPLKLSNGSAIIYVKGDVTINQGINPCYFSGFLYVTGDFSMRAASVIRGQVVVLGSASVSAAADTAEVDYDEAVLNVLMEEIGQYRISRAVIDPESRE